MTRAALGALLSHWRRRPLQLVTLILGLALATALWSGVQAINGEARASYDAAAEALGEGSLAQLLPPEGGRIDEATWVRLRRAGWLASPVVEGRLGTARLLGLDPLTAPAGLSPVAAGGGPGLEAALSEGGALFGRTDALEGVSGTGATPVVTPDAPPGTLLTDLRTAQRILGRTGFDRLVLAAGQPRRQAPLEEVAPGLRLQRPAEAPDPGALTASFHLNLTAFGLLSFAVGLFIVHGAAGLALEERRGTVRTLRALGMPLGRLMALMAGELLALALVAGIAGLALGYALAAALLPGVAGTLRNLYGAEVAGTLAFRPLWALSGLAIALLGTAVAAAGALVRLARTPLLQAGTRVAGARAAVRRARGMAAAGAVLLLAAALLLGLGRGLPAAFGGLGALLVGGALVLPLALDLALRAGQAGAARRPLAGWAWADARAELPGLSLALMALLLAMAANVGVSTMVGSFRTTFVAFLDQRLSSELFVEAPSEADLRPLLPEGARVLPVARAPAPLAGAPGQALLLRDDPTYREGWGLLEAAPGAWDALFAGEGLFANEQLFRRAGLSLGDPVTVAGETLPVLAVYGDYGNPGGEVALAEPVFARLFPDATPQGFGLRLAPDQIAPMAERLEAAFPEAQVMDQSGLKALSLGIFDRTFAVTGALNVLTLAVAGIALLMSLLTLAGARLPQLAPVWAMGTRRAALGRLELLRSVGLAGLTALLALPLGLALAWALLARVNVEAFGWRLPMRLFPLDWLRLFGLALVAAAGAAAWPAWRLARTPPARLLKVFSDER